MKKILVLVVASLASFASSFACTTFFINKNGELVFGRNYDWVTGSGMLCVNLKGLAKTSSPTKDGNTTSWISRYGSITFNQYGKEFPTGGMNEKGLVVELMWLDGTEYPNADDRASLGVLQWIQYQLDNCGTIEEVFATDKKVRIAAIGTTPLHYLIADANGKAATIEFLDGKMVVHAGTTLPLAVLTNNRYDESLIKTATAIKNWKEDAASFADNSIERFARACQLVTRYQQEDVKGSVIDYSFSILDEVAQGSHTKWSIVYDIAHRKVYFKTLGYSQIKNLAFESVSLSCAATSKAWDLNQEGSGDIAGLLKPFSIALNEKIVERSFEESQSQFTVSEENRKKTWSYPKAILCSK